MTLKQLAEEELREQLIEAASAHLKKVWPPSDGPKLSQTIAGLVLDAVLPIIETRDKARAKEFRRLAAEAFARAETAPRWDKEWAKTQRTAGSTWEQAAQMLEEKLQPGYELKVEGEGMNATVEYVDEDPLRWLP